MPSPPHVVFALVGDVRRNSRALRQLRALAELGARVEVLALAETPATEVLRPGVRLTALAHPPGRGPGLFYRLDRLFRREACARPARVYHASDLFTLPALARAAGLHNGALVYDARELYPHVGATAGKPWARAFWRLVERHYAPRAQAVFTVNESIARELVRRYGIAPPTVLYNAPPRQHVARTDRLRRAAGIAEGVPIVLYQGALKPGRGCELLVDVLPGVPEAALVFLGEGPLARPLLQQAETRGVGGRVRVLPAVAPDALLAWTSGAEVGACLIENRARSLYLSLPNKLFEYLMAGVPVLGSAFPEIRRVVEGFDVGRVVDPGDRAAVAAMLRAMLADADARAGWKTRAPLVFETFSWESASQRFKEIYAGLLDPAAVP